MIDISALIRFIMFLLQEFSMECGICYCYKLDTELPNEVCNDVRCRQAFHHTCLYEVNKP